MLNNKFYKTGLSALAIAMAAAYAPASSAAVVSYASDHESIDALDGSALGSPFGEGYVTFTDVWFGDVGTGVFIYSYGVFSAPNGGAGFSAIATGEGGVNQGDQYLNIYSDYNNADHVGSGNPGACPEGTPCTINSNVFQESTISAGDIGDVYTLTFDAKSPFADGIADAALDNGGDTSAPTSATAFIKTLDPNAGYATTNDIRVDMTNVSNTEWGQFSISLDLSNAALEGQLIQFGFNTVASQYDDSGVYYDNICFDNAGGCPGSPNPVPVPAAVWLFGSGLLGLVGVARRRKG